MKYEKISDIFHDVNFMGVAIVCFWICVIAIYFLP